jgi:hypothetical protein
MRRVSRSRSSRPAFVSSAAIARFAALASLSSILVACSGSSVPPNGQSKLYEKTFAGQNNKCNPKSHDRPFIIDWDATDQSSFQAATASDIVFVRYEGCDLKVLDGCRDDSVKGSLGAYKSIEYTSGGVESIDIHDQGELYAKLPLGAASLGGRVESGEKFHMEYYVSGTRTASRDKVFRGDLAKIAACAGATHYVYAYNLGSFALASMSSLKAEVNGSYFGFGAGGKNSSETKAEKKGGDLAACKGESAKEVDACKVPIRLTLREIATGENPDVGAAKAPETDESLNLAGKLKATTDAEKAAVAHLESAWQKHNAKDGKSCLAELDEHDKLDPRPLGLSTNPAAGKVAGLRGDCLMLAGQCDVGKAHFRKALEATKSGEMGVDQMDKVTEAEAAAFCQGGKMSDRDKYLKAMAELRDGGFGVKTKTLAECTAAFDTFMKLRTVVKRKDADDSMIPEKPLDAMGMPAPNCFAKAGDCDAALKSYKAMNDAKGPDEGWKAKDDKQLKTAFDGLVPKCKK